MTERRSRRVGILGGSFDPVHYGHLVAAQECLARLGLDQVLFVPAACSPLKPDRPLTAAVHRVAMVELAIAGNPRFCLSRVDLERPGPSYTVDMLAALHRELGPAAELYLIVGMDSLRDLPAWHRPHEIIRQCRLAAVPRPGVQCNMDELEARIPGVRTVLDMVPAPEIGISSTEIQSRVRAGLPIRYQVPEAVERYIQEHGLYREDRGAGVQRCGGAGASTPTPLRPSTPA